MPWELSLQTEQGGEGETLCPRLHDHPHSSERGFYKLLLHAVTTARSCAVLPQPLTGPDLGAEFVFTVGESKHLSGRRGRGLRRAWKGLSHSLSVSAAEEKAWLPNSHLELCQPILKKKRKRKKTSTDGLSRILTESYVCRTQPGSSLQKKWLWKMPFPGCRCWFLLQHLPWGSQSRGGCAALPQQPGSLQGRVMAKLGLSPRTGGGR